MIISNSHKFVFIHNPKVAGSSIRKMLLPFNDSPIELWHQRHIPELHRVVDMSHLSADEFRTLEQRDYVQVCDEAFRFGFVRDPYARFISALREFSRQHSVSVDENHRTDMKEFVLNHLTPISVQYDWRFSHFRPQYHFFYDGNRRVADYIGRFHRLKDDLRVVSALLNLDLDISNLGMERDTGHANLIADPEAVFGEEVLERINMLYCMDWMLFEAYLPGCMVGKMPTGNHWVNVENVRTPMGRFTYYGEPPNLSLGEKVGFLTTQVERLRARLQLAERGEQP